MEEISSAVKIIENSGCEDLSIFYTGVSSYPVSDKEVNLSAIKSMSEMYKWPIGWSDHSRIKGVVLRQF